MKKILLLSALLASTIVNANAPFQNRFFDSGFNKNIWSDFDRQFQQFNSRINEIQNQTTFGAQTRRYFDKDKSQYIILINTQGLNKENLDITTKDEMIHIKGKVRKSSKTANSNSSASSSFSQSFSLPADADAEHIDASFEKGVLTVSIPKLSQVKPLVQKITIK